MPKVFLFVVSLVCARVSSLPLSSETSEENETRQLVDVENPLKQPPEVILLATNSSDYPLLKLVKPSTVESVTTRRSTYATRKPKSYEECKEELMAEGISSSTADGLISIADKYIPHFQENRTAQANDETFLALRIEIKYYMMTTPKEDQTAYDNFLKKTREARLQRAPLRMPEKKGMTLEEFFAIG